MAEPTLFQAGTLQVTRRRIVADGKQYEIGDITSVEIGTASLPRPMLVFAILFGLGALFVSQVSGNVILGGAGVIALVITGVYWWRANRTKILLIGTSKGSQSLLVSSDRQLIERAAGTIDALLVERGRR